MKDYFKQSLVPVLFFIISAVTLGSLYIQNYGPKSLGDYDMHIYNTYAVATGQLSGKFIVNNQKNGIKEMMIQGPSDELTLNGANFIYEPMVLHPFTKSKEYSLQKKSYNNTPANMTNVPVRTQYPFINWVPQAIGYNIAKHFGASIWGMWQGARIGNLAIYVILVAIAIVIIPNGRWILALIGSFPLSVFLSSSLSGDALNISISTLFVAYVLHLRMNSLRSTQISKKQISVLIIFTLLLFSLKVAYVPLLIIILAIPNRYYSFKKKVSSIGGSGILGLLIYLIWSHKYATVLQSFDNLNANVTFIKEHIGQTVFAIFSQTILIPFKFLSEIDQPGSATTLGFLTVSFIIVITIVLFLSHKEELTISPSASLKDCLSLFYPIILAVGAYLMAVGLTEAALLVSWTKVYPGGKTFDITDIQGFQARYLLPLAPLTLMIYGVSDQFSCKKRVCEKTK